MTSSVSQADIPFLTRILNSNIETEFKYWAVVNLAVLSRKGLMNDTDALKALVKMLCCDDSTTAMEAAYALCHTSYSDYGYKYLVNDPEHTTILETLSLEQDIEMPDYVIKMLLAESDKYLSRKNPQMPGAKDRLGHRKTLVNLGYIQADELYGPYIYETGLKVNRIRKKIKPLP